MLLRISHSPLPIPLHFPSCLWSKTNQIHSFVFDKYRAQRAPLLGSVMSAIGRRRYRIVGNPFNIELRFVALINKHSDVIRHCYSPKTLEVSHPLCRASVFQSDYKQQLDVTSKAGMKGKHVYILKHEDVSTRPEQSSSMSSAVWVWNENKIFVHLDSLSIWSNKSKWEVLHYPCICFF